MNSLVVEGVFLSKAKSNRSSSTPGLPRCVLQAGIPIPSRLLPTTAAATIIAHPSDARDRLHVSPLHAQFVTSVLPFIFSVDTLNVILLLDSVFWDHSASYYGTVDSAKFFLVLHHSSSYYGTGT